MFTINLVSIGPAYGPSVGPLVGYVGPGAKKSFNNPKRLSVPFQKLHQNENNPSAFLSWRSETTEFCGRDQEIELLKQWASDEKSISIKFITGEGGVGKSRLAAEFARIMKDEYKWSAGFVVLRKPYSFVFEGRGVLIVVDYPEEQKEGLKELLSDLSDFNHDDLSKVERKIRILFLSRQPISDWDDLFETTRSFSLRHPNTLHLSDVDSKAGFLMFNSALETINEKIDPDQPNRPVSETDIESWMKQTDTNSRPLFITAAAIYDAFYPNKQTIRFSGSKVMKALAKREKIRLDNCCSEKTCKDMQAFSYLMAAVNLTGYLSLRDLKTLFKTNIFKQLFRGKENVFEELKQRKLLINKEIRAIKPDILAATFVIEVLKNADFELPEFLWQALTINPEVGMARLGRLVYDAESVLGIKDVSLVNELVSALRGNVDRCLFLEGSVNGKVTYATSEIAKTVFEELNNDEAVEEKTAQRLHNLGKIYYYLGESLKALDVTKDAVQIREKLTRENPKKFAPFLAASLNNLGNQYYKLEEWQEAQETTNRAVKILEKLVEHHPQEFEPDLARSLINLGIRYSGLGEKQKALDTTIRAYDIISQLYKEKPDEFESALARCLNNLGNRYSDLNLIPDALNSALESVKIRKKLAQEKPELFESDLAKSYQTLGMVYQKSEDFNKAMDTFHKGIVKLKPSFAQFTSAFQGIMGQLVHNYIAACNEVGIDPDEELIKPIQEKLKVLEQSENS